jgi:hypothetical protein
MQRQEMIAQIQDTLQEQAGGQGAPAKFRLSYLLNKAVDDIAAKYKCCWGTVSGNLVQNQATYPAPTDSAESSTQVTILEVSAVTVYDASGNLHTLQPETEQGMDSNWAGWRTWLANTCPYFAVTTTFGGPIILTPTPNYNSAYDPTFMTPGGFTIDGPCLPALSWAAATAECPLPSQAHNAAVLGACVRRIIQNPTKDNLARLPGIKEILQSELDTFESSQLRYTQATRVPAYTTGQNPGASPGFGFNPLDL